MDLRGSVKLHSGFVVGCRAEGVKVTRQACAVMGVLFLAHAAAAQLNQSGSMLAGTGAAWVLASTATRLAFVREPTSTTAGERISPAVTVELQDGGGHPVAQAGVTITMSLTSGTGTLGGALQRVTGAWGLAVFDDLSIELVGPKLLAAASTSLASAVSRPFTITAPHPNSESLVLSDESGRLTSSLVAAGYGSLSLYDGLVKIRNDASPPVSSIVTDQFLSGLASCPASSDVFTTPMGSLAAGGAVAISADCTARPTAVLGAAYLGQSGTTTVRAVITGVGAGLFTRSTVAGVPLTSFDTGGTTYLVFGVAWAPKRGSFRRVIPHRSDG